ncbi:hypothetical protein AAMO2058_000024400 [Amorphochlora amoebiformis]
MVVRAVAVLLGFFWLSVVSGLQEEQIRSTKIDKCPPIHETCDASKACFSFDAVKRKNFISSDNIKQTGDFKNFSMIRGTVLGKHLRIRSSKNWFNVSGFFTYPMYVMNQLIYAEKMGLIGDKAPFVYMPETQHYFDSCVDGGKPNTEFYTQWFEPISSIKFTDVKEEDVWEFSQLTIESLHHNKDVVHSYPYQMGGKRLQGDTGTPEWATCMRSRARPIFKKYISIKPSLLREAQNFYDKNFGKNPSFGVHMRGTDKWINRKVGVEEYTKEMNRFVKLNPKGKIFLATDDPGFLKLVKERFSKHLVVRNALRESTNVFYDDDVNKDVKVYDVLMDSLVLSQCGALLKSWSAVSEFSIYFHMKYMANVQYVVTDMQLAYDSKDTELTGCKGSDLSGVVMHSYNPAEKSGNAKTNQHVFHRKSDCVKHTPRIESISALHRIVKTNACSRECTAYRSRHMGAEPSSGMSGSKTLVLVIAHWKENLDWVKSQPVCYLVMEKEGNTEEIGADPTEVVANKGNEASSYLRFITETYDNLPDTVLMTHGDRESEHSVDLVAMLQTVNPDSYEFASLNGIVFPMIDPDDYCNLRGFYEKILPNKSTYPPFPGDFTGFSMACCAQFLVSKERILSRKLEEYLRLYNFTIGSRDTGHDYRPKIVIKRPTWKGYPSMLETSSNIRLTPPPNTCRTRDFHKMSSFERGEVLELSWHVLFGEQWVAKKIDPIKLCGSHERCPQNLPIIREKASRSKNTLGVVENPEILLVPPPVEFRHGRPADPNARAKLSSHYSKLL